MIRSAATVILTVLAISAWANEVSLTRAKQDIQLIEAHYKPGVDGQTLNSIRVLALSVVNTLADVLEDPDVQPATHQKASKLWRELEFALGNVKLQTVQTPASRENLSEVLREQLDLRSAYINRMYVAALRNNPTLHGTVILNFTFTKNGYLSDISIKYTDDGLVPLVNMIIPSLATLRTPRRDTPQNLDHALNFFSTPDSTTDGELTAKDAQALKSALENVGHEKLTSDAEGPANAWRKILEQTHLSGPLREEALYLIAKEEAMVGNFPAAEQALKNMLVEFPGGHFSQEGYFRLGEAAFKRGEYSQAAQYYSLSKGENDEMALQARYKAGWAHLKSGQSSQALEQFDKVLTTPGETAMYQTIRADTLRGIALVALSLCKQPSANTSTLAQIKQNPLYTGAKDSIEAAVKDPQNQFEPAVQACVLEGW